MNAPAVPPVADPALVKWEEVEAARRHWAKLSAAGAATPTEFLAAARLHHVRLYDEFLRTVPTTAKGLAFQLVVAVDDKRDFKKVMTNARILAMGTATPKQPRPSRTRD